MNQNQKIIRIRHYNMKQLISLYGVGYKTLRKWLKAHEDYIGLKVGNFYSFRQVGIIFQRLGLPKDYVLTEEEENPPTEP